MFLCRYIFVFLIINSIQIIIVLIIWVNLILSLSFYCILLYIIRLLCRSLKLISFKIAWLFRIMEHWSPQFSIKFLSYIFFSPFLPFSPHSTNFCVYLSKLFNGNFLIKLRYPHIISNSSPYKKQENHLLQ